MENVLAEIPRLPYFGDEIVSAPVDLARRPRGSGIKEKKKKKDSTMEMEFAYGAEFLGTVNIPISFCPVKFTFTSRPGTVKIKGERAYKLSQANGGE